MSNTQNKAGPSGKPKLPKKPQVIPPITPIISGSMQKISMLQDNDFIPEDPLADWYDSIYISQQDHSAAGMNDQSEIGNEEQTDSIQDVCAF